MNKYDISKIEIFILIMCAIIVVFKIVEMCN